MDHLQLLVFFDDVGWQVLGEGEDRCVVLRGEAFFEAKPDGFGADFLELLACTFLGWCGGWKWQPSLLTAVLLVRVVLSPANRAILHAEFHRPTDKAQPPRYSRHFSDFAALWRHPSGRTAAERLDLLERVRLHKTRYFASSWAHYESAVPGTLRLHPPEFRMAELRRDYLAMRPMFIAEPISFNEMISVLAEAEEALNR